MRSIILCLMFAATAAAQVTVTLTVTGPRNSANASVKVNPSTIVAITCPSEVFEGEQVVCTISLSRPAPAGGLSVPIKSSSVINFPATVLIPAGTTSGRLEFTAPPVPVAFNGFRQQIWAHQQRVVPSVERYIELTPVYWRG